MRQPRPGLAAIDTDLLEAVVQVAGEPSGAARRVAEDDHADTSRLPVARRLEWERPTCRDGRAKHVEDRRKLPSRPYAQERERDVKVLARHTAALRELPVTPALQRVENVAGEPERKKEPE
jgi:hypothetical protein